MDKKITYEKSGVDLNLGNCASKIFYEASKLTWKNKTFKFLKVKKFQDSFSSLRFLDFDESLHNFKISLSSDGVGTKIEVAERMKNHSTIAYDLIAMVCDDAVVRGGIPIALATVLDVNSLSKDKNSFKYLKQLSCGYVEASKKAGIVVLNGEIAELSNRVSGYGDFNYNWGATLFFASQNNKLIDGSKIKIGSDIVLLQEKGFRSNGFSLLRKILKKHFGNTWHTKKIDNIELGKEALRASKIYCSCVVEMLGDLEGKPICDIQAVAHITGGGIPEKLGRVVKEVNLGVELNNLYKPNPLMLKCQELEKIPDFEAYKTWCMGQGMAIITSEPDKVIKIAKKHNINAKIGGKVIAEKKIKIKSCGAFKKDCLLTYT